MSGQVLVTADGVIRSATIELRQEGRDQPVTLSYNVSNVGSATAPRPDWASGYPQMSVSTTADSQVLAATLESGGPIPAGTTIAVGSAFVSYGNVTLSESLDTGETLYVTATRSIDGSGVSASIGQQPTVPGGAVEFSARSSVSLKIQLENVELQYGLPERQTQGGMQGQTR